MVRIAIIQFTPVLGNIEANIALVESYLKKLGEADLVILPELASTGYNFGDPEMAFALAGKPLASRYVDMLAGMASGNNQCIVSGFNELHEGRIYNSSLLITPDGLKGIYRKMHLFMHEKEYFTPGTGGLCVYDTGFCRIGMQICFDYLFPEPWRILAQQGAELICHPSNLLTRNATKVLPGLALMNRVYIATANRTGTEGELTFNGGSTLLDPGGEVLAKAGPAGEELLLQEIDPSLSQNKMITPLNHVFDDRRPEQYMADNC